MTKGAEPDFAIATKRLSLRSWLMADLRDYKKHLNNLEVRKHLDGRVQSQREVEEELAWLIEQQESYGHTFWLVEQLEKKEFLGFCGLVVLDYEKRPCTVIDELEIGWRFRTDRQGQGFAFEAADAVLEYAFERLGAQRVVSRTIPENERSWKLMRKLGMRHDYALDYWTGEFRNVVYTIEWRDWVNGAALERLKG